MFGFHFDLQLSWQIILAKSRHKIKNASEQIFPEALFYSTQGHNQSSVLPEVHAEEGILPVSIVQHAALWSFITIWVWGHTSTTALFLLVTALLHHRRTQTSVFYFLCFVKATKLPAQLAWLWTTTNPT